MWNLVLGLWSEMTSEKKAGITVSEKAKPATGKLQPAKFHNVNWKQNQRFSAHDDPDRVQVVSQLPKFLKTKDPKTQQTHLKVSHVHLPWANARDGKNFAIVVDEIFTQQECSELIATINQKGFTPALMNIGGGNQIFLPNHRLGWRCIIDSFELAGYMFSVLEKVIPKTYDDGYRRHKLIDLNERCRFLFYEEGQEFKPHCDGQYSRPPGHPHAHDTSKITIQLYLNDLDARLGGATTFLDPGNRLSPVCCQPKAGSALIFSQNLLHEGSRVHAGGIKYTMRTECMYRQERTERMLKEPDIPKDLET
eukprot:gb/GEZN01010122.1/.p1 GENE.gb/GEZN01010122.1/~~gb/GEZN01010122.1/.p1  ORF type:complete len:324 (+),score=41.92 gb/GEZN01010122.1/:51-974(+)